MDDNQRRLHAIDNYISYFQNAMLSLPRADPPRVLCVQLLARAEFKRHELSGQPNDLEKSILHFTEAIFLPLPRHTRSPDLNIVQIFYFLTLAIFIRIKESAQPDDVKCCTTYLRYLHEQWHEVPIEGLFPVTETLIRALAFQVKLELGDADQDIEEMVDLCNELLNSDDTSIESLTDSIMAFVGVVIAYPKGPFQAEIPSDKIISCLRKATIRLPDLHLVSIVLAQSLYNRFLISPSYDDLEEGMAILDAVISFNDSSDGPSPHLEDALDFAAKFAMAQFDAYGKPEHLEQAIHRLQAFLDGTPLENPNRSMVIKLLSFFQGLRFDDSSVRGRALSSTSESATPPSFRDLAASVHGLNSAKPLPEGAFEKHLNAFQSIERLTDMADVEDGIKYCRQLLTSFPSSKLAPFARKALQDLFHRAFECTNEIKYLDEAISAARDHHINSADPLMSRFLSLNELILLLLARLELLHRREDLTELMQLFPMVAKHENAHLSRHSPLSCVWASIARSSGHPSTSTAYNFAMSSMQSYLTFSPTVDIQHSQLVAMSDDLKTLPLDYASYQIRTGQLEQAIETLERGRVLLWSEMRGLRPSIDEIRLADTRLADKFTAINRDLEALTLSSSLDANVDGEDSNLERSPGRDPFSQIVSRRQRLLDEREKLISQIQALPGLDTFLKPPSFDDLRSSACHGAVVIINHCKWRSDILILLPNSSPSLITTADDFYVRAKILQDKLLRGREKGLNSNEYDEALRSVLKELYDLVGQPVIKRLNELNVPEQSRIWWCPTSVFCSLPLHAMGPIPSDVGPPRYFLDLYIPSYTPSLSALIKSHKRSSQAIGKPSILLVSKPDEKMPQALKEMKAVQAVDTQVTTLFSAKATPTAVLARLRDHPFAHFVCHGILKPRKPFEASFKLHKGKRLLLLDIVRSQLPDAEFSFLSACHTAELTDESIADEVLHLAAAMQFCGFRSVVGTMWAMADIDGRDLARHFYESVFSNKTQDARYCERTAEALRDSVNNLRRKGGITLERWVNFVHYGA